MMHISKEQEPLYLELQQIEKEVRAAAEQAKAYESSLNMVVRTIRKNELTIKQLDRIPAERAIYVPLGRAFLRKTKESTVSEFSQANAKLVESAKEMDKSQKYHSQRAKEKQAVLKEGIAKLEATAQPN